MLRVMGLIALSLLLTGWVVSCTDSSVTTSQATTKPAAAPTPASAGELAKIDAIVRQIDAIKKPFREIEVITGTDSDSFLLTYGTPSSLARIHLRVGLSATAVDSFYYFKDKKLIYMRITYYHYSLTDEGMCYDPAKMKKGNEQYFYFKEDKLISHTTNGKMGEEYDDERIKGKMRFAVYLLDHWEDNSIDLEFNP